MSNIIEVTVAVDGLMEYSARIDLREVRDFPGASAKQRREEILTLVCEMIDDAVNYGRIDASAVPAEVDDDGDDDGDAKLAEWQEQRHEERERQRHEDTGAWLDIDEERGS